MARIDTAAFITPGARRHGLRAGMTWLAVAALAACSVLNPVPSQDDDRFFGRNDGQAASRPTDCIAGDTRDACQPPPTRLDDYAAGLGHDLWDADLRRRQLTRLGVERMQIASAYNALLYPLGALVGAALLADPSASLTRDAAAVALGTYGLLSSGIPDRDKLYLEAARQTSCAMTLASVDLYPAGDRNCSAGSSVCRAHEAGWYSASGYGLALAIDQLDRGLREYERNFNSLQLSARPRVRKAGGPAPTTLQKRLNEVGAATASGSSGPSYKDSLLKLQALEREDLESGRRELAKLRAIDAELRDAGPHLRQRVSEVNRRLLQALNDRAPALAKPDQFAKIVAELATEVAAIKQGLPNVQNGIATGQGARKPAEPLNASDLSAFDDCSMKELRKLLGDTRATLLDAIGVARQWQTDHEARRASVTAEALRANCSADLFGSAAALGLPAKPAAGATP
ncbi:hypothetical protein [Derxia lacustris]|uniref:hypothetical protein n=1 Tax=Derxia lacustris TaxID=764842 RepID=UPI000A16F4C5|nr:hypothetical protein [Derxia lacustris]